MKFRKSFVGAAGLLVIALGLGSCAQMGSMGHTMTKRAGNVAQTLETIGVFKSFLAAAKTAGMMGVLEGKGPITVFAPTDGAFANMPKGSLAALMRPENRKQLKALVANHIIAGPMNTANVLNGVRTVHTMAGRSIDVNGLDPNKGIFYGPAKITKPDIPATNGLIHSIDKVVLP